MPRRLLGVFMLLLVSVLVGRAQGDVAFFTVGADTVGRAEYEYYLRKSLDKSGHDLAQTLARFKQKVQAAKELGLDTASAYRRELEHYRGVLEERDLMIARKQQQRSSGREWIKLQHVTYPLRQDADKRQIDEAKRKLDSLYVAWSEGQGEIQPEEMPWMQPRHLLDEWQAQLKTLDRGVFSKPFYSPQGIHVVAWVDKRGDGCPEEAMSSDEKLFRMKEMEEGLLVASLDEYLEKTTVCTEAELESFFKQHRVDYGWGTPHFRGAVIHCQNKKEAQRIKKYLKKFPEALWTEAWKRMPKDVSEDCRMEIGLFAIGSNPFVDKLVFKCGEFEALAGYPYAWVLGKKLKKGPSTYTDVREKVEKNFKKFRKKAEMEALIEKIRVEMDEEVLKTVNHEGNK